MCSPPPRNEGDDDGIRWNPIPKTLAILVFKEERQATTHWGSLPRLRALGDVNVVEQRFVQDDKIWSSAGVSAGIDMTLAFIAHVAGEESAGKVQSFSEYYPDGARYGNFKQQAQAPAYIKGR